MAAQETRNPSHPSLRSDAIHIFLPTADAWTTFASTDEYLYGVDLLSGLEVWSYWMQAPGFDAPVTDRSNVVFVGDGTSLLHAVYGPLGSPLWVDSSISVGGVTDIVKLGLSFYKELIVASGNSAYGLKP
jgi:hypothetical protein